MSLGVLSLQGADLREQLLTVHRHRRIGQRTLSGRIDAMYVRDP